MNSFTQPMSQAERDACRRWADEAVNKGSDAPVKRVDDGPNPGELGFIDFFKLNRELSQ